VGAGDLSRIAEKAERECKAGDLKMVELVMPLLYLEWERAKSALEAFAAHVRAVEPRASGEQSFDPGKLAGYIDQKLRRKAIAELDLLLAEKGGDYGLLDAKQALDELDFDKARRLLIESGIWKQPYPCC
jgi:hypothetical protein